MTNQKEIETIVINDIEYVKKSAIKQPARHLEGMLYVIVRTYSAGVFAGYLKDNNGKQATLINSRRLWRWSGAASLSQLSQEGVKSPNDCKFPREVPFTELTEVIEIAHCSESARLNIQEVPIWEVK